MKRLSKQLWYSIVYLFLLGYSSGPLARIMPRKFSPERPPFAPWGFEKGGRIYEKLGVRKWKNRVPDVSRVLKYMTPKKVCSLTRPRLDDLIQETIVAELVHAALMALSPAILFFWRGRGAAAFLAVYNLFGNIPYIIIQRYNRPRLMQLAVREKRRNA